MLFDHWPTQTGVQREEREVRIYVFHVRLPGTSYTPLLELSTPVSAPHPNLYLKNKSPSLEEITQVWIIVHISTSLSLSPGTGNSHLFHIRTTDGQVPIATTPGVLLCPGGFSTPCYPSVKGPFIKPSSNFSIQARQLFPSGNI